MRHRTTIGVLLGAALLVLALPARAAEAPKPVFDAKDVRIERVETACNTYLVTCKQTGQFVVVDPGAGITELVAAHGKAGRVLKAAWITHEHGDHLTGLAALTRKHAVPVVAHAEVKPGTTRVVDGGEVRVGALTFQVLHLPGHSPGSVGYLLPGRVLVAGDVLFQGSIGRTDLRTSDPKAFEKSLGVLWALPADVVVLPGHGKATTIGAEKQTNWLFQDFVRAGRGEPPIARPWVGVELASSGAGTGLRLAGVVADSPAAKAGLAAGDTLVAMDGVTLTSGRDLLGVIRRHAVGDTVPVVFRRGSETKSAPLTFAPRLP